MKPPFALLLAAAITVAAVGCTGTGAKQADEEVPQQRTEAAKVSTDSLLNSDHIPMKVVIAARRLRAAADPGGKADGHECKFFHPYYVFQFHPSADAPTHVRIGTTTMRESIVGWVPVGKTAAERWDTRVGVVYASQVPLLVYADKQAAAELAATGRTSAEPIARATPQSPVPWMPWPVAAEEIVNVGGKQVPVMKLLFLGEMPVGANLADRPGDVQGGNPNRLPDAQIAAIRAGVRKLDCLFVVDNTASTTPFLTAIKDAVKAIAQQLAASAGEAVDIAFGLVLYRDFVDGLYFDEAAKSVTRTYPLTNDLAGFVRTVDPLQAATVSSVDYAEAGYDGALGGTQAAFRDRLAHKIIIMISDNSYHDASSPKNPNKLDGPTVVKAAKDNQITIFGLRVAGAGGEAEQARHAAQQIELCSGTGGTSHPIGDHGKVVDGIRAVIAKERSEVETRDRVVTAVTTGKTREAAGVDERQWAAVMTFLKSKDITEQQLQPGVPTFATGWCPAALAGVPLVEPRVYLSRKEVEYLRDELSALGRVLNAEPKAMLALFGTAAAAKGGFMERRVAQKFNEFQVAKGIPCRSGILALTQNDIETMNPTKRQEIAKQVWVMVTRLTDVLNDNRTFRFVNDTEFGWIPDASLP